MLPERREGWTNDRHERVRSRILLKMAQRQGRDARVLRGGAAAAAVAVTLLIVVRDPASWQSAPPSVNTLRSPASTVAQPMRPSLSVAPSFETAQPPHAGGAITEIRPLGATTALEDVVDKGKRLLRLKRGALRVHIEGQPEVPVQVVARGYLIEHLGTTFTVALEPKGAVRVVVEDGLVRITGRNLTRILKAGQTLTLLGPSASAPPPEPPVGTPSAADSNEKHTLSSASTVRPVREMDHVQPPPPLAATDDVRTLLLWVDGARAAGHVQEAIAHLDLLIRAHGQDRRTSMAHFLRGKLLMEVGRPQEALADFRAIEDGPLLADAQRRAQQALRATLNPPSEDAADALPTP